VSFDVSQKKARLSELVRSACTLDFVEHEFVDFFGDVSPLNEDACSYTYTARRDGMRLEFTIFPLSGEVYADIFRDGVAESIVRSRLRDCTHARFVQFGPALCLEIGRPHLPTSERSAPLSWGLRLIIDPHLRVELIHERG